MATAEEQARNDFSRGALVGSGSLGPRPNRVGEDGSASVWGNGEIQQGIMSIMQGQVERERSSSSEARLERQALELSHHVERMLVAQRQEIEQRTMSIMHGQIETLSRRHMAEKEEHERREQQLQEGLRGVRDELEAKEKELKDAKEDIEGNEEVINAFVCKEREATDALEEAQAALKKFFQMSGGEGELHQLLQLIGNRGWVQLKRSAVEAGIKVVSVRKTQQLKEGLWVREYGRIHGASTPDWEFDAVECLSYWQGRIGGGSCASVEGQGIVEGNINIFRVVVNEEGDARSELIEDHPELAQLKSEFGEDAQKDFVQAVKERDTYNSSGGYAQQLLWVNDGGEGRVATLAEGVEYLRHCMRELIARQ